MVLRWLHHEFRIPGAICCPGNGSRSLWGWNFTQNSNFIKDVTGRNKNYQKYQLWAPDEFIIPPSSRALALHALIISLEPSGKIVKMQNDCREFTYNAKIVSKISNLSFNFDLKTSCALPPYYSLELDPISSTSHYYLISCPGEVPDHSGIEFWLKMTISLTTNRT